MELFGLGIVRNKIMKDKLTTFFSIVAWGCFFFILLKIEDRFWLGFLFGISITLTIIVTIKTIKDIEKNKK